MVNCASGHGFAITSRASRDECSNASLPCHLSSLSTAHVHGLLCAFANEPDGAGHGGATKALAPAGVLQRAPQCMPLLFSERLQPVRPTQWTFQLNNRMAL
jgi:hypothetical protein